MKRTLLLALVLLLTLSACGSKVVCNAPYILVGSSCCLDANNNKVCDADEKAPAASASTTQPAQSGTPEPTGVTLALRTVASVQSQLGYSLNIFDDFTKDSVPALHNLDTTYAAFTFYGSPTADILDIKDPSSYFTDISGAKVLIDEYAKDIHEQSGKRLEAQLTPLKRTFTLNTSVTQITLRTGVPALELRDRASIVEYGATTIQKVQYSHWVDPYGSIMIFVPCGPNMIIGVYGANDGVGKFAANYEGDQYMHELESSLDEISQLTQYKAEKISQWCAKPPKK